MRTLLFLAVAAVALTACQTPRGVEGPRAAQVRRDSPVPTAHPYEMDGVVKAVGGSGFLGGGRSVTVARREAPDVQLHVADRTRITLDDRPARLADLREGDEVRAVFDFDDSSPVAIDIVAKKPRR